MATSLVLGIDLGTTSVKVTLIEPVSKNVILSKHSKTNANLVSNTNCAEQNVAKILQVLKTTLCGIPQTVISRVNKVGICGQMHGCMFWKSNYKCMDCIEVFSCCSKCSSNLITWQDQRCTKDFLNSLPQPNLNCLPLSTGFGCATIFWLNQHNTGFLSQYDCAGTVQDFLVARLCDMNNPVMSSQNAVSWGYCDVTKSMWDKGL